MEQSNKQHRKAKDKNTAKKKLHTQGHNAKAFAVAAPGKMARTMLRSSDVNERKLHVPMIDRTPDDDPPPFIVAVVGPPGTGKTTLIKSLVRRMTKSTLNDIQGPVTVVSGKHRRLTFLECPADDLNAMIDIAKIADLVLLLIDGNFGFEMETMEFLNIAQHHGMPRVLGVATHLDLFKSQSTLRASKKRLKHRFWTEVYQGAKLFYLSGVMNGRYPDREILNLSRFISVMKFRPLKWRNEHPYMLADRFTDLTHPELLETQGQQIDRRVALYGYLHGTPLPSAPGTRVHIAGVGDFSIAQVEKLPDPCPTPFYQQKLDDFERERMKEEAKANGEAATGSTTRRRKRLDDKDKLIYAPMSDVGGVLMDKDAVYIDIGKKNEEPSFVPGQERGEGEKLMTGLQTVEQSIAEKFDGVGLQLFSNGTELHEVNEDEDLDVEDEEISEEDERKSKGRTTLRQPKIYGKSVQDEDAEIDNLPSDEENYANDDDVEGTAPRMVEIDFNDADKQNSEKLALETDSEFEESDDESSWERNAANKLKRTESRNRTWNIGKLIYMDNISPEECIRRWRGEEDNGENESDIEENVDDEFFKKTDGTVTKENTKEDSIDLEKFAPYFDTFERLAKKWNNVDSIKARFLGPGIMGNEKAKKASNGNDEEVYGDFEDLEDENGSESAEENSNDENEDEDEEEDGDDHSFTNFDAEEKKDLTMEQERELNATKKEKLRAQFEMEEGENFKEDDENNEYDTWYELQKAKISKQLEINNMEYQEMTPEQRQKIEGFKAGSYVRIVFEKVPMEFITNFNPKFPVVMGGLLPTELKFGIIKARLRRHRWHKKILKTNDPLVLSLGWRRFQTLPVYTTSDSRTRTRMLKYTPEHTYCNAAFYGPLCSPNTPFCGVQIVANSDTRGGFRIAATGVVEEIDVNVEIVKKLKLVGFPYKVFKNTAFIKDMFSSAMEVARFEGAQIKTVSGIRGEIKRALSKPEGHFRASFEDKILMSDIVILRSWYPVHVKRFYNPVTSLLLKEKTEWKGVRLTGQIRAAMSLETPSNPDSAYQKIQRVERHFNGLKVPRAVQKDLPFKSQIHQMKPQKKKTYMAKRAVVLGGDEKKARSFMQKVLTISRAKDSKKKEQKADQRKERLKKLAKKEEEKTQKDKEKKKEYFAKNGKRTTMDGDDESRPRKMRR
ncbi:hypothetical protein N7582_005497 [Saccharomyces uvarum]|uniref:Bms1-type G domain-containing protein n=1 Tax=Saccharomyces uvarum TaxID=230603 RepID=A0AA35J9X7_SACUV|nr:hypothetical protein N7582_005497 [Saccharomyces uvarum]CAI4052561.1 hypothetical protein SUVC_16G0650 [Saccharomyces uvarum]